MNVKKGITVKILSGDDKGKTGKVLKVFPKLGKVLVEGVNMTKRHERPRKQGQKGQIVEVAMPVHTSNVAPTDSKTKK
jgi:large subunit ribosomal protein L24